MTIAKQSNTLTHNNKIASTRQLGTQKNSEIAAAPSLYNSLVMEIKVESDHSQVLAVLFLRNNSMKKEVV